MRFPRRMLLSPVALLAIRAAAQSTTLPELKFQDAPNFYRSAIYPPADVSSNALLYYLLSADGHVYRHYDALNVPGG